MKEVSMFKKQNFLWIIAIFVIISDNKIGYSQTACPNNIKYNKVSEIRPIKIEIKDAQECVYVRQEMFAEKVILTFERQYQPGDTIIIEGPKYISIRLDLQMPEELVYSPTGRVEYKIPYAEERLAYSPESFAGLHHVVTVQTASDQEIAVYGNIARNVYDVRGGTVFFPHATSNNE
jgi:hypothetical protein